jgi:putative FmdB family regulatory protein
MPLYEYHCPKCQADFELLIRGGEAAECPTCQSQEVHKLLSVPATPSAGSHELPTCRPMPSGGCGLPQCGMGQCGMH